MSDSDTGETSRFKMKHIEPVTNAEDTATRGNNSQNASNSQIDNNQTLFTTSAQKVDKHKMRKNKRKREPSPESSSSISRNSFFSGESVEEGNSTKSQRFQIISKAESHKWELPGEMPDYVNHQFEHFIPVKDVEENLLILNAVPENVRGVKKLDDFAKSVMGQSAQVLN